MSSVIKEFQINLFSNADGYNQTLASFSNVMNPPILLNSEDNFHVGVSQIFFPSFNQKNGDVENTNDVIYITQESQNFYSKQQKWTIKDFCNFLVNISQSPTIYSTKYFEKYLYDYHFDSTRFQKVTSDDIVMLEQHDTVTTFVFDLNELLEGDEIVDNYIPKYDSFSEHRKYFNTAYVRFNTAYPYKLNQILNTIIRHLLGKLKSDIKFSGQYVRFLKDHYEHDENKNNDFSVNSSHIREFMKKTDKLIKKFIKKFVDYIHQSSLQISNSPTDLNDTHFVLIYCSIIKETNIGNRRARVIHAQPFDGGKKSNYYRFHKILYHPIETFCISEIHILITDLFGNRVKFLDQYTPTCISLSFKSFHT